MGGQRCCVPGCKNAKAPFHNFPNNRLLFEEWVKRVKHPKLDINSVEFNRKYRVCHSHFNRYNNMHGENASDSSMRGHKLLYCSVPTVNVPGYSGPIDKENSFLYPPKYDCSFLNNISRPCADTGQIADECSFSYTPEVDFSFPIKRYNRPANKKDIKSHPRGKTLYFLDMPINNTENDNDVESDDNISVGIYESDNLINDGIVDIDDMINNDVESHDIITDGIVESHAIIINDVENQHIITDGVVESQHINTDGVVESQHIITDGVVESQHMITDDVVESQCIIIDGVEENQHIITDGVVGSQHIIADGFMESHAIIINDDVESHDMISNDVQSLDIISDSIIYSHNVTKDSNVESHDPISHRNIENCDAISHSIVESSDAISDGNIESHDAISDSNIESNDAIIDSNVMNRDAISDSNVESHDAISDSTVESREAISDSNVENCNAISDINVENLDVISDSNVENCNIISDSNVESCDNSNVENCNTISDSNVESRDDSNVENRDAISDSNVENCNTFSDSNVENRDSINDNNVESHDKISHSIVERDSMTNKSGVEDDNLMEIDDIKEEPLMEDPLGDVDEIINQVIMMEEGLHQRFIKEEPIDINDTVHVDFTMGDIPKKKKKKSSKENRLSLINKRIVRDRSQKNLKKNLNEMISSHDDLMMHYFDDGDTETTTLRQSHVKPTRNKQTQTDLHNRLPSRVDNDVLMDCNEGMTYEHLQETSRKVRQSDEIKKTNQRHPLTIPTHHMNITKNVNEITTLQFHNYAKWDLRNLCRLCSKFDDTPGQMKSIYTERNLSYKIAIMCPLLTLTLDDGLPQQICFDCCVHIEKAYEFYKSSYKYEKYLRNVLNIEVPTLVSDVIWSKYTEEYEDDVIFKGSSTNKYLSDMNNLSIQFVVQKTDGKFCCPFCDAKVIGKCQMMRHFRIRHLEKNTNEDEIKKDIHEENAESVKKKKKLITSKNSVVKTEQCIQRPQDVIDTNYISNVKAAVSSITEQDDSYENVPVEQYLRVAQKSNKLLASLEDPLRCDTCYVTFATFQDKKAHDETHSARVFSCPSCSQVFSTANYVNEHSSMSHGLTTEECRISSKKKSLLYECEHCASLFIQARQLQLHRKECLRAQNGTYMCRCTKVFHDFFTFFSHFSGSQPCFTFNPSRPVCKITHLCPLCFKSTGRLFGHVTTSHPEKVKELNIMDIPLNEILSHQI